MGTYGKVASPLWPGNYPHNSDYQWIVNVNASQVIQGRILEMDIESTYNCYYDKLKVSFQVQLMLITSVNCYWQNKSKLIPIQALANCMGWSVCLNSGFPPSG